MDVRWSNWENFGGIISSEPSAVSWDRGRIDMFARRTDNAISLEGPTFESRCNLFAEKGKQDPNWAFNSILKFVLQEKKRVENKEIRENITSEILGIAAIDNHIVLSHNGN